MKKRIFICGQVYDLAALPLSNIEQQVQHSLDVWGQQKNKLKFQIQQPSANEIELIIYRSFSYEPLMGPDVIYEFDAEMITGYGLPGFTLPEPWFVPCRGFTGLIDYYIPIVDFLASYKKSARALKASRAKDIQFDIQPTFIMMRLVF